MVNNEILGFGMLHSFIVGQHYPRPNNIIVEGEHTRKKSDRLQINLNSISLKLNSSNNVSHTINSLVKLTETGKITSEVSNLMAIGSDIHWMLSRQNDVIKHLNMIQPMMKQILEDLKQHDQKEYISEEISNLEKLIKNFSADPFIPNMNETFKKESDFLNQVDFVTDRASRELKDLYRSSHTYINLEISSNPSLKNLDIKLTELKEQFPELLKYKEKDSEIMDLTGVKKYISDFEAISISAYKKMIENGLNFCQADNFVRYENNKNATIKDFVKNLENKDFNIMFDKEIVGSYDRVISFHDDSIVFRKKDGTYVPIYDIKEVKDIHNQIIKDSIRLEFNKNPQIAKNFIEIATRNNFSNVRDLEIAMNTYKSNMDILKMYKVDPLETYLEKSATANKFRDIEVVDDYLNKVVKEHKIKQYAHSISSNKYDHLYNEDTYAIAGLLYETTKKEFLQEYIGKKIAAFKTPDDLNAALKQLYSSLNDFTMEAITLKAENNNVRILVEVDDLLIVEVIDFEQSKVMGSPSWCIARDESYFKSYTGNGKQQYFVYDFLREAEDESSMIGITLDNGECSAAHYKDDEPVDTNDSDLREYIEIINNTEVKLIADAKNDKVKKQIFTL